MGFTFCTRPDTGKTSVVFPRDHLEPRGDRRGLCWSHEVGTLQWLLAMDLSSWGHRVSFPVAPSVWRAGSCRGEAGRGEARDSLAFMHN